MTLGIDVKHMLIAISVFVSLHPLVMCFPIFSELNFLDWSEQVQVQLGVWDLDLTFQVEKPTVITYANSNEEKAHYRE